MYQKVCKIFFPPISGLLLVVILLQAHYSIIYNTDDDVAYSINPLFDMGDWALLYLAILAVTITFQMMVVTRIWRHYKAGRRICNLALWQLFCLSCLSFGIVVGLYTWIGVYGIQDLVVRIFVATGYACIYWLVNLLVFDSIEKRVG